MKNINAIKTFMQENGVHFEEEFYVDFGEKQEIFNIDNLKKFSISQDDEELYFTNDSGEEISCEEIGNILFNDDVHVITKNYFETMMNYYISISKICDDFNNNETECTKCPAWSCNDGCFFIDSYIPNGIVENLGIQHHLPIPRDYKYKIKFLCKCRDYKELIGDTNE